MNQQRTAAETNAAFAACAVHTSRLKRCIFKPFEIEIKVADRSVNYNISLDYVQDVKRVIFFLQKFLGQQSLPCCPRRLVTAVEL